MHIWPEQKNWDSPKKSCKTGEQLLKYRVPAVTCSVTLAAIELITKRENPEKVESAQKNTSQSVSH